MPFSLATFAGKTIDSIERNVVAHPIRFCFLLVGLLFALLLSLVSPVYETSDDITISMIVSGTGISDRPDEHLIFSHVLIGLALKTLYTFAPNISWYGVYLLSVNYLANVAALYSLLIWRYSRNAIVCFLFVFAVVGIPLIIKLQFTSTAAWSTECGILLLLTVICRRSEDTGCRSYGSLLAGAGLMILGSMVRIEAYLAVISIGAIPFAVVVWQCGRRMSNSTIMRKMLAPALLIQCIVGGLYLINYQYYSRDPEWHEFFILNPCRVKFNDYQWTSFTAETKPVFDRVNWNANDYELISKYSYYDEDQVFSQKNLQAIVDGYPWMRSAANWRHFGEWWLKLARQTLLWPIWALLPIQLWFARDPKATFKYWCLVGICIDAVITGLMFLKAPVYRMYYPLFAFQILLTLGAMRWERSMDNGRSVEVKSGIIGWWDAILFRARIAFQNHRRRRLVCTLAIVMAVVGSGWSVGKACHQSIKLAIANIQLREMLSKIDPRDDELYVCWVGCFPFEALRPLDSPAILRNLHLLGLGWTQKTPINLAVKSRFQIRDSIVDLREKPNVYFFTSSVINSLFSRFVKEHYETEWNWRKCFSCSRCSVWKAKSTTDAESDESFQTQSPSKLTVNPQNSVASPMLR